MLILPTSLDLMAGQWHHRNQLGYLIIGLGFFVTCLVEESTRFFEQRGQKREERIEAEQLLDSPTNDKQLTHLVALVFALGVHYFFGEFHRDSLQSISFDFLLQREFSLADKPKTQEPYGFY